MTDGGGSIDMAARLAAHAAADRPAIIGPQGTMGYGELAERVASAAAALTASGLDPAGPVGVAITDEVDHLVVTLALMTLGAPSVVLAAHDRAAALAAIVTKVGVTQYVGSPPAGLPPGLRPLSMTAPGGAPPPGRVFGPDEPVLFRTTSGTTGTPKIFAVTGERLTLLSARAAADPTQQRILRTSSVEYDSSRLYRVAALTAGNCCVFSSNLSGETLPALCATADVTEIHIGTYKLATLMAGPIRPLPAATSIQTGGSRVPGPLRAAVQDRLCRRLFVSYATSEAGLTSLAGPDEHADFPEGIGHPVAGVTVEIVDPVGEPVRRGETGEIRVFKAGTARRYVGEPEASAALAGGWFRTRDLASWKEGEPIVFHGRSDDMMVLGGINVFPGPIEDLLEAQPEIAEAVAYPLRSNVHGQIPVAAVVLRPGHHAEPGDLLRRCRAALGYGSPRQVFIVDRIPRTDLGKPLRRELPA